MFYSYFLTTMQYLKKQPVFSAIKILSLTLGLTCSIIVIMHVQYTYSFDKHIPNWQNIHRLVTSFTTDQRLNTNMTAEAYVVQMRQDYAQIVNSAMIRPANGQFTRGDESSPNNYYWVEPEIIDVFSLEMVRGDRDTALADTNTVVINETTATKYFGQEDPIGQILTLDDQTDLRVTAVMRDFPPNTHLDIQMMLSVATGRQLFGENFMNSPGWAGFSGTMAYFTLPNAAEAESINNDLEDFVQRNVPDAQRAFVDRIDITLALEPLGDIYLSPRLGAGGASTNRAQVLNGLMVFALLILVTSSINFANLSLSQMRQRRKEIGVRKTLGATRGGIVTQFLFESITLTFIALLIALPLVYLAIPAYTALTDTEFTAAQLLQTGYTLSLLLFVLFTGFVSGLFPALAVSTLQPATTIKGTVAKNKLSSLLRSSITVIQFTFATTLVLLAFAISQQVNHLQEMNVGFERSNLVILDSTFNPRNPDAFNFDALINDLRQHPGVISIGKSQAMPPDTGAYNPWGRPEWDPADVRPISHFGVDTDYIDTYQLQLIAGRGFSEEFPSDFFAGGLSDPEQIYGVVITEAAVRNFGFDSPEAALDQILLLSNFRFRIVGVVNNFRLAGGMEDVLRSTSVLRASAEPMRAIAIRIDPNQLDSTLNHIDSVWARHRPAVPVNRSFFEQTYNDMVADATDGINIASLIASVVTILIAALGLYALAYYTSQRRTKEIGIRKVLGATSHSIVTVLTWDFIKPVLVACALSWIAGYFAMNYFYSQFSSRPDFSIGVFGLVSLATLMLAMLTVILQCLRAASADPVKSLRYE